MHCIPVKADCEGALDDGGDELGGSEDGSLGRLLGLPLSLPEGVFLDGLDEQPLVRVVLLHEEKKEVGMHLLTYSGALNDVSYRYSTVVSAVLSIQQCSLVPRPSPHSFIFTSAGKAWVRG